MMVVVCIVRALRKTVSRVRKGLKVECEQRRRVLAVRNIALGRHPRAGYRCQCEVGELWPKSSSPARTTAGCRSRVSWRYTVCGRAVGGAAGSQLRARRSTTRPVATDCFLFCFFPTGEPQLQIGCVWGRPLPWPGALASRFVRHGAEETAVCAKTTQAFPPRRDTEDVIQRVMTGIQQKMRGDRENRLRAKRKERTKQKMLQKERESSQDRSSSSTDDVQ